MLTRFWIWHCVNLVHVFGDWLRWTSWISCHHKEHLRSSQSTSTQCMFLPLATQIQPTSRNFRNGAKKMFRGVALWWGRWQCASAGWKIRNGRFARVWGFDKKNSRVIDGKLRVSAEQYNGAINQEKVLRTIPYQFMELLGEAFCQRLMGFLLTIGIA